MNQTANWLQRLTLCSFLVLASTPVPAQIAPDNKLGAESSSITPNVLINGANADRVEGGAQRGSNLFHSFSQFNVGDGQRVYFGNPNGIQNILTRVTGGNASNILGTLGVEGSANLFLLNPNGIIFGQNASLDLRGAFVGTTANAIGFGNQGNFSATNPQAPPLLNVNPSALLYTQINGGEITNRARPRFPEQGSRFLVGGNITFDGGQVAVVGNRLEFGGLAGEGTVGLTSSGNELQLNFPSGVPRADVVMQNNAAAFTTNGGAVTVQAGNLSLSENSSIFTFLDAGQGSPSSPAGDVVINATGAVKVDGKSSINSLAFENSLGDSGNITIDAESIHFNNTSKIITNSEKNRGSIRLNAMEDVTLDGNSLITTLGSPNSIGNSGDITVNARNISLSNGSTIDSGNIGQGRGGRITLQATDAIALASGSTIESGLIPLESGVINSEASGKIEIAARSLSLDGQGTYISSINRSEGRASDIRITTDDSISLNGYAYITSSTSGQGDGGKIELTTRSLAVSNGSSIGTQTTGKGNSGNLLVNASDSVTLSGTAVVNPSDAESFITGSRLSTEAFSSGNSGQLTINTGRLSISDGGGILTRTNSGQSSRGDLTINASEAVEVVGTDPNGVSSRIDTATLGSNDAGNLTINTGRLSIRGGGLVRTEAVEGSTGQAGNLTVNATDAVEVIGVNADQLTSRLSTATAGAGTAGNLTINTRRLSVRDVGVVDTSATKGSTGQAGNLTVNAIDAVEVIGTSPSDESSSVLATSTFGSGNAGNLNITTSRLSVRDGAFVSTEARQGSTGQGGNLTVNASEAVEVIGTSPTGQVPSALTTSTDSSGNAGSLNITTSRLSIRNGGFVGTAASEGNTGQGGNLTVNASEAVEVGTNSPDAQDSVLSSFTAGSGNAGRLSIDTRRLSIRNGGGISSGTVGSGQGGNLDINASESVEIVANPADTTDTSDGIVTTTVGSGNAGDLNIRTQRLSVQNGGLISASTFDNTGRGGNLTINASDTVEVVGISNDGNKPSRLSVSSGGEGAAGNISVNSPRISVRDRGAVTAESSTVNGGNINLNADILLLRRNGTISATAGAAQGAGNGGNITIDADFIIAVLNENSDITANAFQGQGGNIKISSQGIFGIQPRSSLTELSDITASSAQNVQGQIDISEPNVQPEQGLVELPEQILDASNQIAQTCPNGATANRSLGEFVVTGRGSLPPNPLEPIAGTTSLSPLATLDSETAANLSPQASSKPTTAATSPKTIVEAQGWVKTMDGKIALVAHAPETTPSASPMTAACPEPN